VVKAAELLGTGVGTANSGLVVYTLTGAQSPCGKLDSGGIYWGDYDDMVWLGGTYTGLQGESWQRFYTTFTRNGPACTADAIWTGPMDVYGATLW
jgi:hypothetical protein